MPVTEQPVINTTEISCLLNLTEDSHPIHLHLVQFQILDRRPFDIFTWLVARQIRYTGPALARMPKANISAAVAVKPGDLRKCRETSFSSERILSMKILADRFQAAE
jgi:FtsP/CotA-like multicopper oxidase with cupredoxin domain